MATNEFCLYLKHQTRIYMGRIEPCCWFNSKTTNAFNPDEVDEYKKRISQINTWGDECNHCWHLESTNKNSPRLRAAANPGMFGVDKTTGPDDIVSLEVQFDSECNAACLVCGTHNSTTWQKYQATQIIDKNEFNKKINLNNKFKTQQHIEMVARSVDFSKIRQLVFLGGEPLINDTPTQLIHKISKVNSLNTVSLRYVTNGSRVPTDEIIELWKQCKDVKIILSIDGIGEHFNYHRWPLQWHQVEKNIKFFRELDLPNLKLGISSTATPFNIFYYDQYLDWQQEFFKDHKTKLVSGLERAHAANGNEINLYSVPSRLAAQIKIKYKKYPGLSNLIDQFDPIRFKKFMEYVQFHDQKRGTNWKEVFPEIVEYFE
jgi:hypothetical protein